MFLAVLLVALLFPSTSLTDAVTCEKLIPEQIDSSICDDIRSAIFIFRYAIRDIDAKVRNMVYLNMKLKKYKLRMFVTDIGITSV